MRDKQSEPVIADRVDQPAGVPERLAAQIRFILEADQLKAVLRRSPLLAAQRRENDAEHSWHLALMVLLLAEYADEPVDVARTLSLVIVHDLVEIYAGDTFLYDEAGRVDQAERERRAADRLFALLPDDQAGWLRQLWDEFEERATPEARFAKAMDRLQPLLLNFNGRGGTWRTVGVTDADVRDRKAVIGDASQTLWEYGQRLIDAGVLRGWLAPAGPPAPPAAPAAAGAPASPAPAGSPLGAGRDGGGEAVG
jgi:putative hydrolase of HD superfamily